MAMARYITSQAGYSLIKTFEGFREKAAPLASDGWVIGYGHTVSARKGAQISKSDAAALLQWDITRLEAPLCDLIYAPLSQNQFDALVSLVFNIGLANFQASSVLRRLNEGCPVAAAAGFDAWRRAKLSGEVIIVDALVRRRAAEKALFLASPDASVIAPTPQLPPLCDKNVALADSDETPQKVNIDLNNPGEATVDTTQVLPASTPGFEVNHQVETNLVAEPSHEALVSLDDAFESDSSTATAKADRPVVEIAEQIAGRLETIATEPETNADESANAETKEETLLLQASDQIIDEPLPQERAEPVEDTPPLVDEEGLLLEPYEARQTLTDDNGHFQQHSAPFPYDEPQYDASEPEPQSLLQDAEIVQESTEFQPAYDRGRFIFIIMGIIGIVLILGGVWQFQNTVGITTNLDFAKGPGQAFLGVLLVISSAYYLLRRLNR
jgi:lysozyme